MGTSNDFNDNTDPQYVTVESLSLTRAQRMTWNIAGTFFNMLEKVATEYNLSDRPGNIFNIDESGIQINNKPDFLKKKSSKNVHALTSGERLNILPYSDSMQ